MCAAVFGNRSNVSAYARDQVKKVVSVASEAERRSILADPDKCRRYAWLLSSPAHVARLRTKGAYAVLAFADDDVAKSKDCLDVRDWVAKTFACETTTGTGEASPRDYFITWRIFQERQFSRYVYLPRFAVERGARAAGITVAAAAKTLVTGPPDRDVVTHAEYAKMQASIRSFLRNAVALSPSATDRMNLKLDGHQTTVAKGIVLDPFSVLHGGAGTGKSTLIAEVVQTFLNAQLPVLCLAPTHRAKKNLAARLPKEADVTTIDSFIKSASGSSSKAGVFPEKGFIFVDEASMVDLEKLALLARARMSAPGQWQVCLTGDDGQLEPIDRGEMFRTMIHNGGEHVHELVKCYRAENDDLLQAQRAIRDGRVPESSSSVQIRLFEKDIDIERALVPFIEEHKSDVQYIAWTNKMCDFVNAHVQRQVHGSAANIAGTPVTGDRVVYIGKNQVRKGLTNAMLGTVTKTERSRLDVRWDDGGTVIQCARSDVILAYCVTVHRAQGSQFAHVCVIATNVSAMAGALDRRWAYTAVSRAQRKCDLFSTKMFKDFVGRPVRKRELVGINFNFKALASIKAARANE